MCMTLRVYPCEALNTASAQEGENPGSLPKHSQMLESQACFYQANITSVSPPSRLPEEPG